MAIVQCLGTKPPTRVDQLQIRLKWSKCQSSAGVLTLDKLYRGRPSKFKAVRRLCAEGDEEESTIGSKPAPIVERPVMPPRPKPEPVAVDVHTMAASQAESEGEEKQAEDGLSQNFEEVSLEERSTKGASEEQSEHGELESHTKSPSKPHEEIELAQSPKQSRTELTESCKEGQTEPAQSPRQDRTEPPESSNGGQTEPTESPKQGRSAIMERLKATLVPIGIHAAFTAQRGPPPVPKRPTRPTSE